MKLKIIIFILCTTLTDVLCEDIRVQNRHKNTEINFKYTTNTINESKTDTLSYHKISKEQIYKEIGKLILVTEENYIVEDDSLNVQSDGIAIHHEPYKETKNIKEKKPLPLTNYNKKQTQQQDQYNIHAASSSSSMYTREITIKQGRLKGIIRVMHPQSGLRDVDQYFGVPYAEAPVGNKRFMPPGAPPPWTGIKIASELSPVCPQNLPNINAANNHLSKGRYNQLKRLLPYLKLENEDCLYLNLYVPMWEETKMNSKYPVIIYIHGESYEWNSGNPYDGSVLASYGQVIVVTINYRLGILGFMKPGINDHIVSNFGLLDQIAALQWVKDNIHAFGGDNSAVTVMGHGTGAACVNLLMVSPVAKGLFHRAILLSGSALSDWATTHHPWQSTMQIAQGLNCPLSDANEEMLACLRRKRYTEILRTKTSSPQFSTPFGPVIDGLVVPNQPHKVMGQYSDIFSRYDLLFGMTELESYHILNTVALNYGLLENERDNLLRFYMQNRFEIRPDLALVATLREYTDIYRDPNKALAEEHRDTLLEILSDARVACPLVQTGLYHAKVNPKSYMYVFAHNSEAGEYAQLAQSVVGEELAYIFGAPLAQVGPFQPYYNPQERLFSEAIMKYWSNFAKTGNPKAPWRDLFLNLNPVDWERYDVDWPEFNNVNQSYLNLGIPPVAGHRYRFKYMKFWNHDLPEELKKITTMKVSPPYANLFTPNPSVSKKETSTLPDIINGHMNLYPIKHAYDKTTEDPYKIIQLLSKQSITGPRMYNAQGISSSTEKINRDEPEKNLHKGDTALYVLIGIVIILLLVVAVFAYVLKKSFNNRRLERKLDDAVFDCTTDEDLVKRSKVNDGDESFILDIVRKTTTNTNEPVKINNSPIVDFKLVRQLSSSTMDPHSKVRDWISQEIIKNSKESYSPDTSVKSRTSFLKKPKKVSVAIDATPQARSNSILRQEPIEITKAKSVDSANKDIIICQELRLNDPLIGPVPLRFSMEHKGDSGLSLNYPNSILKIDHKYSKSDPVESHYLPLGYEKITSFIEESDDINVTCRDDNIQRDPLTPEEALRTIQRRNFPKVLPDYPNENISAAIKRRSLPAEHFIVSHPLYNNTKVPPAPPPRTSSTLGRKSSNRRTSKNMITSPLMLAEEPPVIAEPTISSNTLIVGPLIPKNYDSHYSTVKKQKREENIILKEDMSKKEQQTILNPIGVKVPTVKRPPSSDSQYTALDKTFKTEPKIVIKPNGNRQISKDLNCSKIRSQIVENNNNRPVSSSDSSSETTSSSTETVVKRID